MIVRPLKNFIETKGTNIPTKALDEQKHYEVIIENKHLLGRKTYFLLDDMFTEFPTEWNSRLFEVIDQNRDEWTTSKNVAGFPGTISCKAELLSLLKSDSRFFEHLVDGESDAVARFSSIFPNLNKKNS